jgi:membrane protease YdiL (CAAX protease family)
LQARVLVFFLKIALNGMMDMGWFMGVVQPLAAVSADRGEIVARLVTAVFFTGALGCAVVLFRRLWGVADGTVWRVGVKPWTMGDLGLAVIWVMTVILGTGLLMGAVGTGAEPGPVVTLGVQLYMYLVIGAGISVFMKQRRIGFASAFGFDTGHALQTVGMGLVFCFAFLPLVAVTGGVVSLFYQLAGVDPGRQLVVEWFATYRVMSIRAWLAVFAVVVAPVAEEGFFRGIAYPALKQQWGAVPALLLSSAAFGLIHGHLPSFPPLFVLGLGLALAYEWTGSLLSPIAMHAAFNGLSVMSALGLSNGT